MEMSKSIYLTVFQQVLNGSPRFARDDIRGEVLGKKRKVEFVAKKIRGIKVCSVFFILSSVGTCFSATTESFVVVKKTGTEKPSHLKEEIVDSLESLLTSTSDLIASIAQEQHLIIQKVRDVAQSQGVFAQTNPQALKRYRDSVKKMEQNFAQQAQMLQKQFVLLKKDFSERA